MAKWRIAILVLGAGMGLLRAEPPFDVMKQQTVIVRVELTLQHGYGYGHGSGLVIADGRHIVTNNHVCCLREEGETGRKLFIQTGPNQKIPATVKWASPEVDLSVLEVAEPLGRPTVTITPGQYVHEGQQIYVLGFPGVSDRYTDEESQLQVKISSGVLSAKLKAGKHMGTVAPGTPIFQSDAPTNRGNSGGPVFDACGNVIAVHSAGAYDEGVQGVKFEIPVDALLAALPGLGLKATLNESNCVASGGGGSVSYLLVVGQVGSIALGLVAVMLAVTRRGRESVKKVMTSRRRAPAPDPGPGPVPPPLPAGRSKAVLKGIAGYYSGSELELGEDAFTIGRDGRASSLVIPSDGGAVSRRHCTVRYDSARGRFFVEDCWSTNGTFLGSGEQLPPGQERELKPGDRFYVGSPDNTFEVAVEKSAR